MIVSTVKQGTPEWAAERLGIPTCSQYHRILTPTLKAAAAAATYRAELLAEWALQAPIDWGSTDWTIRGTEMEAEARKYYEYERDVDVRTVGFLLRDDRSTGGSPDGLVGDDGILEIKCLGAKHHVECLLGDDKPAKDSQVQGYLWITGRAYCDVLAYHPTLPSLLYRVEPDPKWLASWEPSIARFLSDMERGRRTITALREGRSPLEAALTLSLG